MPINIASSVQQLTHIKTDWFSSTKLSTCSGGGADAYCSDSPSL